MEQRRELKRNYEWNERFQKSIFDLTDEERRILKEEAKQRRQKQEQESKFNSNSIELFNMPFKRIIEMKEIATETNVNLVHNLNTTKISGTFENMKNFLRKSGISNNAKYLFGIKTSY